MINYPYIVLIQNNWLMLIICRVSQRWSDTERRESSTILIIDVEHCTRSLYKKLINKGFGGDKDSYSFSLTTYETHLRRFNETQMGLISVSLNCLCIVCCHTIQFMCDTRYDTICVLYDKDTIHIHDGFEWKFDTKRPIFHFVMFSIDVDQWINSIQFQSFLLMIIK